MKRVIQTSVDGKVHSFAFSFAAFLKIGSKFAPHLDGNLTTDSR